MAKRGERGGTPEEARDERAYIQSTYPGVKVRIMTDHPDKSSDDLEIRDKRMGDDPTMSSEQDDLRGAGNPNGDSSAGHWFRASATDTVDIY